jgi:hypothetical protein
MFDRFFHKDTTAQLPEKIDLAEANRQLMERMQFLLKSNLERARVNESSRFSVVTGTQH